MKGMKPKMMSGSVVPSRPSKMMKSGGSIGAGPVGTGGMKNPNKTATCNTVNQ